LLQPSTRLQVTHQLYEGVWRQWVADTTALGERLPASLDGGAAHAQDMLTFERWLILLKVASSSLDRSLFGDNGLHVGHETACESSPQDPNCT
jgi:hypothetical protein